MDCTRARSFLHPWLDGELERTEHTELVDHLTRCEQCDARFRDEQRFLKRVQTGLASPCPSELKARVFAGLCAAPARPGIFTFRRVAAAAVLVLGVTFVGVDPLCFRGCPKVHALTEDYHRGIVNVTSCTDTVAFEVKRELGETIPECCRVGYPCKGWSLLCPNCGRGCLVYYDAGNGRTVSFFKLSGEALHPYLELKISQNHRVATRQDGCRVICWREGTELCGFVGDDSLDEGQLAMLELRVH